MQRSDELSSLFVLVSVAHNSYVFRQMCFRGLASLTACARVWRSSLSWCDWFQTSHQYSDEYTSCTSL